MSPLFSRHILACLHFNENLRRETQVSKDGKPYMRVTYPKFKLGEEVVREVAFPPSYGNQNMRWAQFCTWLKILLNYNQVLKSSLVLHTKTSDLQCWVLCYSHLLDKVWTAFL